MKPENLESEVGRALRGLFEEHQLSQTQVALRTGISYGKLWRIMTDRAALTKELAEQMARACGFSEEERAELVAISAMSYETVGDWRAWPIDPAQGILGQFIEEKRKARGLTSRALAKRIGMKPSNYSNIESAHMRLNPKTASKIVQELDLSREDAIELYRRLAKALDPRLAQAVTIPELLPFLELAIWQSNAKTADEITVEIASNPTQIGDVARADSKIQAQVQELSSYLNSSSEISSATSNLFPLAILHHNGTRRLLVTFSVEI